MRKIILWTLLVAGVFFFCPQSTFCAVAKAREENPYAWEKLSEYTTYYSVKDGGRCENIAIAASLVDGVTLQPYGEFSFNATVGKRTEEAGFQEAKIIVNGEYVLGVGGGVCQVSTTLYNAALKAGLEVTEYHPHSLRVGYVPASRDAMVSTHSDLKIFNPLSHAVHINLRVIQGGLHAVVYGKNEGYRYELVSRCLGEIPPPPPIVKEGIKEGVFREEKAGMKSELYLERYKDSILIGRKRLRTDEYRPIQGIIVKKVADTTNKMPSNACFFLRKML
jgi:hypothetical protein